METMAARPIPAHVPPDMIGNFSLFSSPGLEPTPNGDPQAASAVVHDGPRIFYSPVNTRDGKGTWVITRAQDQRRVRVVGRADSPEYTVDSGVLRRTSSSRRHGDPDVALASGCDNGGAGRAA